MRLNNISLWNQWIVFGAPDCPRVAQFVKQVRSLCGVTPLVISYCDVLSKPRSVLNLLVASAGNANFVRLETPGKNPELKYLLIHSGSVRLKEFACGARNDGKQVDEFESTGVEVDKAVILEQGSLGYLHHWYEGLKHLLDCIETLLAQLRCVKNCSTRYLIPPGDILAMFDKTASLKRLNAGGVSTPAFLGTIDNFQHLGEIMRLKNITKVFVKPNYSASAAGIIALQYHPRDHKWFAATTVEYVDQDRTQRFFNTRRLRHYTDVKHIETIVDYVASNKAYAECWLPKSQYHGMSFDVRVVVVAGRAVKAVARLSRHPITNLHLGNNRLNLDVMHIDKATKQQYISVAQDAMGAFPEALYAGVDVLIPLRGKQAKVLEVNAFGDFIKSDSATGTCMGNQLQLDDIEDTELNNCDTAPAAGNAPCDDNLVDVYTAQITAMFHHADQVRTA